MHFGNIRYSGLHLVLLPESYESRKKENVIAVANQPSCTDLSPGLTIKMKFQIPSFINNVCNLNSLC